MKHFELWADNCGAQNKNWALYTALCAAVFRVDGPRSSCVKYLETGHTFMSADSFHRVIEQRMKKVDDVCDFWDFTEIINSRGIAAPLKVNDIIMYSKGVSTSKYTSGKPNLSMCDMSSFERVLTKFSGKRSGTKNIIVPLNF